MPFMYVSISYWGLIAFSHDDVMNLKQEDLHWWYFETNGAFHASFL